MIKTKKKSSLRSLAGTFDREGKMMNNLSTKLLAINMPTMGSEYGKNTLIDLVTTIDTEEFMKVNKGDHHVFTIDKNGNVKCNLNLVSYLKAAP